MYQYCFGTNTFFAALPIFRSFWYKSTLTMVRLHSLILLPALVFHVASSSVPLEKPSEVGENLSSDKIKDADANTGVEPYKAFRELVPIVFTIALRENWSEKVTNDDEFVTNNRANTKESTTESSEDFDNYEEAQKKVASAATTLLAMALTHGLVPTSTKPSGLVRENLVSADEFKIGDTLLTYVVPGVNFRLAKEFKALVAAGRNPVQAMNLAMENAKAAEPSDEPQRKSNGVSTDLPSLNTFHGNMGCKFDAISQYVYRNGPNCRKSRCAKQPPGFVGFLMGKDYVVGKFCNVLAELSSTVMRSVRYNDVDQLLR